MATRVDLTKCDGCEDCVETCPTEVITMVDGHASIDEDECLDCEACIEVCPNEALYME